MLSKESGLTVFIVNLLYDFYRNWSTIKKTVHDVRWNHESYRFAKRMFCVLVSFIVLSMARIALLQGSLPRFSQQDNPAAFHSSFQVRFLTFLYLSSFNSWLLLCPSQLSHDWQMGSIPLIMSFRDTRNILTLFTFCVILLIIYKIYNDLEVSAAVLWLDLSTMTFRERFLCVWINSCHSHLWFSSLLPHYTYADFDARFTLVSSHLL